MRTALLVAALMASAVVTSAGDTKPAKCKGEPFVINGKKVCFVAVQPEDYYRTADMPQKDPAPGSLVITKDDPPGPHLKFSGHLMANDMMVTGFNPAGYTYERDADGRHQASSDALLSRSDIGWGLSAQWSPNNAFWIEAGWQRPQPLTVALDTRQRVAEYGAPCGARYCPYWYDDLQSNRHRFTADDFTLAIKGDTTPDNEYVSILVGAGIHRRYLRDVVDVSNVRYGEMHDPNGLLLSTETRDMQGANYIQRTQKTRLFALVEFELYPAGKDRFVGLGISARMLSDGNREAQHFTDTLMDQHVMIGIEPGWYDVTARLILRF